ncbi:multiple coagulation factor deficiency protein 2 homolog [Ptychodera flava]|uniref:multiple coagulation factor deficiency protein 2 homolog n=1 Tax=Ptychodera flava TaxID=63121 RepID=UPI003969CA33
MVYRGIVFAFFVVVVACLLPPSYSHADHGFSLDGSNKFHDPQFVGDKEHIQEHLQEVAGDIDASEMTQEEYEFHFFKLHDADNDGRLDGLEILAALTHEVPYDKDSGISLEEEIEIQVKRAEESIDKILKQDDFNRDGYLSYLEYTVARRRGEAATLDKELDEDF